LFPVWLAFGMSDRGFLTHFVRLVSGSINTGTAHIQGVWLLKCETNWLHYRTGIFTLCILYPVSHFVQKEISPSLSVSFPRNFNILLINGHSYCVTSSRPTVMAHQLRNTNVSVWSIGSIPRICFRKMMFWHKVKLSVCTRTSPGFQT
jgi:hypothetical protein